MVATASVARLAPTCSSRHTRRCAALSAIDLTLQAWDAAAAEDLLNEEGYKVRCRCMGELTRQCSTYFLELPDKATFADYCASLVYPPR